MQVLSLLPVVSDPNLLVGVEHEDDAAVYAQGEARLARIDRATLEVSEPLGSPQRATGGGAASLPTGVTLIAGGEAADGSATDVWQLFSPALPAD